MGIGDDMSKHLFKFRVRTRERLVFDPFARVVYDFQHAGLLFNPNAAWIGAHWSPHNRRLCINIIPFLTLWVTAFGGETP